jgi:dolichol-phosphate mannosyltransferase
MSESARLTVSGANALPDVVVEPAHRGPRTGAIARQGGSADDGMLTSAPRHSSETSTQPTCATSVTVIVPTRNEQANIKPLLGRLDEALKGLPASVVFVDDSEDDTPQTIAAAFHQRSLDIRMVHREPEQRVGGLGGAVLEGLRSVTTSWAVVMDGDLQHPPELIPELLAAGEAEKADVVVASRHIDGGSSEGLSNRGRVWVSDASIALSKLCCPRRLKGISDPMSGYFALRPSAFDLEDLRPMGFKILLEMLARTPNLRLTERPFVFGERVSGESKATLREGVNFFVQLSRLLCSNFVSRQRAVWARGLGFAAVGATGVLVNMAFTWLLADPAALHLNYVFAAIVATQFSSTYNFAMTDTLVYRQRKRLTRFRRWAGFLFMSNLVLCIRVPAIYVLVEKFHVYYLLASTVTLFLGFAVRFRAQERLTMEAV